jgi:hypothetical protein
VGQRCYQNKSHIGTIGVWLSEPGRTSSEGAGKQNAARLLMNDRKAKRVVFERGYPATIMAIDGTWRRACTMLDVSDAGATLSIDGPIEGLPMSEFFLVLSSMGKTYRRCQLAWVNGNQVGVDFLKAGKKIIRASDS